MRNKYIIHSRIKLCRKHVHKIAQTGKDEVLHKLHSLSELNHKLDEVGQILPPKNAIISFQANKSPFQQVILPLHDKSYDRVCCKARFHGHCKTPTYLQRQIKWYRQSLVRLHQRQQARLVRQQVQSRKPELLDQDNKYEINTKA